MSIEYLTLYDDINDLEYWGYQEFSGYLGTADPSGAAYFSSSGAAWSSVMTFEYEEPDPSSYNVPDPPQNTF